LNINQYTYYLSDYQNIIMLDDVEKNLVLDILYLPKDGCLIPEVDDRDNVEYKLRLDRADLEKCDNMVSQMLWRMNEGKNKYGRYEAHYILGVYDDGRFGGLTDGLLMRTIGCLKSIIKKANAMVVSEKIYAFPENKTLCHVVIRKNQNDRHVPESNIVLLGASNSGKSSVMGRLTYGQKDDGNGFTRKLVLRHSHEKVSGVTTSIKYDTIGFVGSGSENIDIPIQHFGDPTLINYGIGIDFNLENIYNTSDRLINIIDPPGDIKYTKTILRTISSIRPEYTIICIPCYDNTDKMLDCFEFVEKNKDIYQLIVMACQTFDIQPIIVLSKMDLSESDNLDQSIDRIIQTFQEWTIGYDGRMINFKNVPIIKVSNITDQGYELLINSLSQIKMPKIKNSFEMHSEKLFVVNDSFTIPDTGTIFHGIVLCGTLVVDDQIDIYCHGVVAKKKIKSIHRKTLYVDRLYTGESGSITFHGKIDKYIDKTLIIMDQTVQKNIVPSATIVSLFGVPIKPQQYSLFISNNIVTVILTQLISSASDDGSNKLRNELYKIQCIGSANFPLINKIGVLKDEQNNYYFIKFIN
jgi:GTPase